MNKHLWVIFYILLIVTACQKEQANNIIRPQQPWALRSVLDYKPRMLTLTLDSAMYVAYDLEKCRFYKAWRGGVNWDGIVYNDTKSVQPTSWGTDYVVDPEAVDSWWIEDEDQKVIPDVRFSGYRFDQGQIFLSYTLSTAKDTIQIEERPEYVKTEAGAPGLERIFFRKDDSKLPVFLSTQSQVVEIHDNRTVFETYFEPLLIPAQEENQDLLNVSGKSAFETGRYWLEKSDCFTCHEYSENNVGPGFTEIAAKYVTSEDIVDSLAERIKLGGSGVWGITPMNAHPDLKDEDLKIMVRFILSLDQDENGVKTKSRARIRKPAAVAQKPGFGAALEGVHPSYDLSSLEPEGYDFKVGGLAFFPDGRLLVATWSPLGSVYILDGVTSGDTSQITVKLFAQGLAEPLGAEIVDGSIFVLQKHELTQLIDRDGDEVADEYRAICNGFGVSTDFHEFAFGLVHKDGHFYANLSLPMRLMANENPLPDRGRTVKIAMDGSFEHINHGLRQPNGIGLGVDDQIFTTDNQGQWLPGNKLIHVRPGKFHGMRWGLPDSLDIEEDPPAVWLPQSEIGNSPSEPTMVIDGPYQGQMLHGDITHGGIKRVFMEKINGEYQGVVFRFSQGFKAGVNRLRWGPDGALYIGEAGMIGGWSWKGNRSGLQRIKYNGKSTFEMLAIRSGDLGFTIEFTEPLAKEYGNSPNDYHIKQWWYLPTESYGGPKMDIEVLNISKVEVASDRRSVFLEIQGLKSEHVVYFKLNQQIRSASDQELWSSEAWYTLNNIAE